MDKNAIKKYATWARRELISRVSQKAEFYGVTAKGYGEFNADSIDGRVLSRIEKSQRQALINHVRSEGYEQAMEEVAYTWFNRFSALRYMEVNNYLPARVRVFTNEAGEFKPQIIDEAIHIELDGLDMEKVYELKEANATEALYRYLLITQCNALSKIMPVMFQKIADYTELLLPDYLLREGSVIEQMVTSIPEENWRDQIEIIGWLYQYYISEKHDQIINIYKGTVQKDDVPAATQLFTTDWVVRYMVDNSLGRYWIERHPESNLADKLDFFVKPKNGEIPYINEKVEPQDLTFFDCCMGSGHIVVYAFDVLMEIYEECGYTQREAVSEIIQKNLHGFDIDKRCSQLAYFSVMMKARSYDRRFFTRGLQPQTYYPTNDEELTTYGSLVTVTTLEEKPQEPTELTLFDANWEDTLNDWNCRRLLSQKYAVVCTNPPYLNKYNNELKKFVTDNYKAYSGDLFSVYMYRNFGFCRQGGYSAFMTPYVWMFIKTYENLRRFIIESKKITTLVQMEYSAFEEATVPICSFVLKNGEGKVASLCFRLSDFKGGMEIQKNKVLEAIANPNCGYFFEAQQSNFTKIPSLPVAYWVSKSVLSCYEQKKVYDYAKPCKGIDTGDNNVFLRFWHEVNIEKCFIPNGRPVETRDFELLKWFPYNKGGNYRKWYGNNEYLLNWEDNGETLKNFKGSNLRNKDRYFSRGITWSTVTSGNSSFRWFDFGYLFDNGGSCLFSDDSLLYYIQAMLNSVVSKELLKVQPTLNNQPGTIGSLPLIISENNKPKVETLCNRNISLSKTDWDAFETSWDFIRHPIVPTMQDKQEQEGSQFRSSRMEKFGRISWHYDNWANECANRFALLKSNEEELNRIFIDIYGLQDELTPEVEDKDVTVRLADKARDIRSFISYAVGCMFGRYSLDVDGLAYAGGEWDASKYNTFIPDKDGILPICDDEYFEDDIANRFVDFVRIVYGKDTLEENLKFIADALGGKGAPRQVIRDYFMNDFYADHLKVYQKRPIYWLFDSGRKNGFKCLIYIHRYKPDTIARIRTDYVHEQQARYRTAIAGLENQITNAGTGERVKLNKQLKKLQDQADELHGYEEKIHHLADQFISIDLDDGVKHNYEIFKDVLAKIK